MATSKQKVKDATETETPDVIDVPSESTALTVPETTALAAPRASTAEFDASTYEARIEAAHAMLEEIIAEDPEFGAKLQEAADYTVAKVEGIAGDRAVTIPHISIRQSTTKEESLPGDVKNGHLFTKQDVIDAEIEFIPLFMTYKRVKFVQGQDTPECFSNDGKTGSKHGECNKCPYKSFEEGTRAQCTSGRSFAVVKSDFTQLFYVDFMKTSSRTGKKLENLASSPHGIFKRAFRLFTEVEKNDKGQYYVFRVMPAEGPKLDGTRYRAARALFQFFEARHELNIARGEHRSVMGTATSNGSTAALTSQGAPLHPASSEQEPDFGGGF